MEPEPHAAALAAQSLSMGGKSWCRRLGSRQGVLGVVLVLLIAVGALGFRLQQLERRPLHVDEAPDESGWRWSLTRRPLHVDEAVQAVKAGELYDSGQYRYNPLEFHGPSLYYFTLPVLKLSGAKSFAEATDADFRLVPVLFGVGLILLLLPLRRDSGSVVMVSAAVLIAVSPAMVYYSRYYIQEMLLVAFAGLALCALWRYFRTPHRPWSLLLGLAIGLMYATKETSVIFCAAMSVAYGWLILRRRYREGRPLWNLSRRQVCHLLLTVGAAAMVAMMFYSSLFSHPRGPLDSLLAFRHYFDRSGGDGSAALHQQPWYYYLKMLCYTKNAPGPWWSEGFILALAAVGFIATACRRVPGAIHPDLALLLAVYTLCMTLAFSLIPYKTPWNMLGFLHGLILMAGIGASTVFHCLPRCGARAVLVLLLLAGARQLAAQASRAISPSFCADPRNPYVYAHSVPDVVRLARRISEIAALHADGRSMRIHFITPDYWPLPYYLRKLNRVGYWSAIPASPDAPVIVVNSELQEQLEPLLRERYHTEFFGLRPGVLLILNIEQDLWERYLRDLKPVPP
ncbi:MAG: TIGR03663 family protein [Verrucomicrobia bacterium]|nr:TIGR03663 family protein [Verrucomicrobiota bacterium]